VELTVPNLLNLAEIKKRRQALGLTLTQAAIAAGWNDRGRTTWHDIEVGRRQNITLGGTLVDVALKHIGTLTKLEHLGLGNTKIAGPGLKQLAGLSNLRQLSLGSNRDLSPAAIGELQKALPKCMINR
jgi:hypothetical protein